MTAPDLTPEQRETLDRGIREWEDHGGVLMNALAPVVARMLADARAEGDRQGAARVAAAIEAVCHHAAGDVGHLDEIDVPWVTVPEVRAALAEAQEGDQ